jgi:hypothetical protein
MATPTPTLLPTLSAASFDIFSNFGHCPLLYSMLGREMAINIGCELGKFCTKNVQAVAGADSYWSMLEGPSSEFTLLLCP